MKFNSLKTKIFSKRLWRELGLSIGVCLATEDYTHTAELHTTLRTHHAISADDEKQTETIEQTPSTDSPSVDSSEPKTIATEDETKIEPSETGPKSEPSAENVDSNEPKTNATEDETKIEPSENSSLEKPSLSSDAPYIIAIEAEETIPSSTPPTDNPSIPSLEKPSLSSDTPYIIAIEVEDNKPETPTLPPSSDSSSIESEKLTADAQPLLIDPIPLETPPPSANSLPLADILKSFDELLATLPKSVFDNDAQIKVVHVVSNPQATGALDVKLPSPAGLNEPLRVLVKADKLSTHPQIKSEFSSTKTTDTEPSPVVPQQIGSPELPQDDLQKATATQDNRNPEKDQIALEVPLVAAAEDIEPLKNQNPLENATGSTSKVSTSNANTTKTPEQSPAIKAPEQTPTITAPAPINQTPNPIVHIESHPAATTPPNANQAHSENPKGNDHYLIQFNNVGMIEYLNFISKITNKNFVFDDADLDFKVSIVSNEPTSVENIMAALLQELRVHELSLMEVGNALIIHRNAKVNSPGSIISPGNTAPPNVDLVTQVFKLNNSASDPMAAVIRPLLSDLALVESIPETSHLIVTDLTANVNKIAQLIQNLDSSASTFEVGQYVVQNASVDSITVLAEKILTPIAKDKTVVLVPHSATNSIFIVSSPYLVQRALNILRQIDIEEGETRILSEKQRTEKELEEERAGLEGKKGGGTATSKWASTLPLGYAESTKFYIKKLQYQRGDKMVDALKKIADSLLGASTQNTSLITTINSIQWIESINSLIYTGTEQSILKVNELIDEIDIPLRQILIEVLVVETDLDDSLNFGVDFGTRFGGPHSAGAEAFLGGASPLVTALDASVNQINGSAVLGTDANALARIAGFNLGVIGKNVTHCGMNFSTIGALVSALNTSNNSNIVLNPKIVVEDNTPAEIFVGLNVAFQTQAIANELGNLVTSNFEFRDVGATLKVTPLIGNNDIITLDISQEISSIVNLPTSTGTASGIGTSLPVSIAGTNSISPGPTTRKSKTTTRIHVPNEYFVILSGMIQDEDTKLQNDVPCLGGLPIIGAAFGNWTHQDTKRNLMIFIRPQIVVNDEIDMITKREQDMFIEESRLRKRWEYETDGALEYLNLKGICDPEDPGRFNP